MTNRPTSTQDILTGAQHIASFQLSAPRMREFGLSPVGVVSLKKLKDQDADYVAILNGPRPAQTEILGYSDDLAKMIDACSSIASREHERDADGKVRLVTGAELKERFAALAPDNSPIELSQAQITCAITYAEGDFAHLVELAQTSGRLYEKELAGCGDSLFRFLMRELDPREDCSNSEEAVSRLDRAIMDIMKVKFAVEDTPTPQP
ncbi:hypothetical protein [Bosea sp. RAC05]|uniref:hypothetical protein n=1 Tax=Bosea sp. RAC05 TaxID=1842539 RepID=UPI00083CE65A|nr:hypothetical protein [Bosea sp. RAC05]AOG03372.1 hypothetical protein BSY19_5018 [Bosea sp. RAC05]